MDKVQFNTEVVNMRKLIKRVKVLIVHSLTRQVSRLRKKKGSEQQILKNQRRVTRFVAEIEAVKDLQADFVTMKAVTFKKNLQDILNNSKSSAHDRVLARVIHHRLIQERVTRFKDMVTKDLLRTGTKKYRRLRKGKFEADASSRLKEEEDYQVTLEKMIKMDQDDDDEGEAEDDDDEGEAEDDDDDVDEEIDIDDDSKHGYKDDDDVDSVGDEDGEISNEEDENNDSLDEDGQLYLRDSIQELHKAQLKPTPTKTEARLNTNHEGTDDMKVPADTPPNKSDCDVPQTRGMGKNKMDTMFLGNLSTVEDEELTEMLLTKRKEQLKRKTQGQQLQKQQPKSKTVQQRPNEPTKKTVRKVPMVDQPNPIRQTSGEKLIPGINCHPDLPPRHAQRDIHEKTSGRPFPVRPQSKQFPTRQPANQSRPVHPTAATKAQIKTPVAKETLHPSWEASKKRKEESKIVPFQGKKITFDDD